MKDEWLEAMDHVYTDGELTELLHEAWDLYGLIRMAQGKVYDKGSGIEMMAALRTAEKLVSPFITYMQWSIGKENRPGVKSPKGKSYDSRISAA
jgi:hypothetical protein